MPAPTDKTIINEEMESAKKGLDKEKWLKDIHSAAPGVDWEEIEAENRMSKFKKYGHDVSKDNTVNIADGLIVAEWNEKGSNNLSGSITATDLDTVNNIFYAISAGGNLWAYDMRLNTWSLINDKLRFDNRFLKIVYPQEGQSRIICSINGKPYHSDTGIEWQISSGPQIVYGGRVKNARKINDGKYVFYLIDEGALRDIKIYYSDDYGSSFSILSSFNTSDLNNMSMDVFKSTSELYVIEQLSASQSRLYHWNMTDQNLDILESSSPISFGASGRGNLRVRSGELGNPIFYCYDNSDNYYQSVDLGKNWMLLSQLPARPWQDGVFVSYEDPQLMILSEVEAHISKDGGLSWSKINSWGEYYDDPIYKLHADMMHIDEYVHNGQSFISIANHGGLNLSYDKATTNRSIAQFGLNVSQYYSVRTYPANPDYIFAGSQDQGIQRGFDFDEGTLNFTQLFSGDYGHICFSNLGESMWTVYPGGWVFYFDNPITQNYASQNYNLESNQESVWLPPMITSPYGFNAVLLAGGNINGGSGSHIIELKVSDFGSISVDQWPHNFATSGGTVTGMTYNKFFSNVFYAVTSNGRFYRSVDSGRSFQEVTNALNGAHYLYGHEILSSNTDPGLLYVAGSGYSNSPIFRSTDSGMSFHSIKHNLPNTTIFDIAQDPEGQYLFAATEAGPYVYVDHLETWFDMAQGIAPNQTYWSVEYLHGLNKVRFGTYGRGIWDFDLEFLSSNTNLEEDNAINIYPNPAHNLLNIDFDNTADKVRRISISNAEGKIMKVLQPTTNLEKIDISTFSEGLYYVIFESENDLITKKFIKI